MRRKRQKPGDVFSVRLNESNYGFGRVLTKPLMAFYDLQAEEPPSLDAIVSEPILFKIWVMNWAFKAEGWEIIGNVPIDATLATSPNFFKQDAITGEFSIYGDYGDTPCTLSECEGLERAAVWDPDHVEDRLRDHFNGVPNVWVESMKPTPSPGSKLN